MPVYWILKTMALNFSVEGALYHSVNKHLLSFGPQADLPI